MEMPPEKSETVVFLGQDPEGYKIVGLTNVYKKYRILNISVLKFPVKVERYLVKTSKICSNTGNSKQHLHQRRPQHTNISSNSSTIAADNSTV
jgi:hypothetical protein